MQRKNSSIIGNHNFSRAKLRKEEHHMLDKQLAIVIRAAIAEKAKVEGSHFDPEITLGDIRRMSRVAKASGVSSPTVYALQKDNVTMLVKLSFSEPERNPVVDGVIYTRW